MSDEINKEAANFPFTKTHIPFTDKHPEKGYADYVQEEINKDPNLIQDHDDLDMESALGPQVILNKEQLPPRTQRKQKPKKQPQQQYPDIDQDLGHRPTPELEPYAAPVTQLRPEYKQIPEIETLNEYTPDIMWDIIFPPEGSSIPSDEPAFIDTSLNILNYLKALGYVEAMWEVGPEYDDDNCTKEHGHEYPICWERYGTTYRIEDILSNATLHSSQHEYYPDKPILALSHPGCACHLVCLQPTHVDQIPDSAPHLPMNADRETLQKFKEKLFSLLTIVNVDRWTMPYDLDQQFNLDEMERFTEEMRNASSKDRVKTAGWKDEVKPIRLKRNFLLYFPLGIIRPIPKNYFGFQISTADTRSRVYLLQLGYIIDITSDLIEEVSLVPSEDLDIEQNPYVMVDGELGLIIFHEDYDRTICYLPEFGEKMEVDSYQVMKIV